MHVWKAKHQIVIVRKHSSSFSEDSLKYISQSNMLRMQQIIELETSYSSMKLILVIAINPEVALFKSRHSLLPGEQVLQR